METDPNLLLALLAVRLLGGRSVNAAAPLLKNFKVPLQEAVQRAFLQPGRIQVTTTTKAGKLSTRQVAAFDLTEQGQQFLRQAADPAVLAATNASYLASLRQNLAADHQQLRKELQDTLKARGKGVDATKVQKEMESLSKKVADLAQRLQKLEAVVQGGDDAALLTRMDQAFAVLLAKLDHVSQAVPVPALPGPAAAPASATSLTAALHHAYRELCRYIEFKDGLVELPRLYHETQRTLPTLSVPAFKAELEALWQRREVELHVINEVVKATERDKGIEHNNKLYYYLLWKRA